MPRAMRDELTGDFLGRGYDQRMRAEDSSLNIYDSASLEGELLQSTPMDLAPPPAGELHLQLLERRHLPGQHVGAVHAGGHAVRQRPLRGDLEHLRSRHGLPRPEQHEHLHDGDQGGLDRAGRAPVSEPAVRSARRRVMREPELRDQHDEPADHVQPVRAMRSAKCGRSVSRRSPPATSAGRHISPSG